MGHKNLGDFVRDGISRLRHRAAGKDNPSTTDRFSTAEVEVYINPNPEKELEDYHEKIAFTRRMLRQLLVEYAFKNGHQTRVEKRYTELDSNVLAMKALEQLDAGELVIVPVDALKIPLPDNHLPIVSTLTIAESTLLHIAKKHGDIASDFDPQNVDTEPRRNFLRGFNYRLPVGLGDTSEFVHFVGIVPNFYNTHTQILWQNRESISTFVDIVHILRNNGLSDNDIHMFSKVIFAQSVYAAAHFMLRRQASEDHVASQQEIDSIVENILHS
jgi:hypothetical protein